VGRCAKVGTAYRLPVWAWSLTLVENQSRWMGRGLFGCGRLSVCNMACGWMVLRQVF